MCVCVCVCVCVLQKQRAFLYTLIKGREIALGLKNKLSFLYLCKDLFSSNLHTSLNSPKYLHYSKNTKMVYVEKSTRTEISILERH